MINVRYELSGSCSWSRTTFFHRSAFIVLFSVHLFFFLLFTSGRPYRPLCTFFSSPVLSAYWWEILAGSREISEMKGAVKNAINCKLIFKIKANHARETFSSSVFSAALPSNSHKVRAMTSKTLRNWCSPALRDCAFVFFITHSVIYYYEIISLELYSFLDKQSLAISK